MAASAAAADSPSAAAPTCDVCGGAADDEGEESSEQGSGVASSRTAFVMATTKLLRGAWWSSPSVCMSERGVACHACVRARRLARRQGFVGCDCQKLGGCRAIPYLFVVVKLSMRVASDVGGFVVVVIVVAVVLMGFCPAPTIVRPCLPALVLCLFIAIFCFLCHCLVRLVGVPAGAKDIMVADLAEHIVATAFG
jgi:hypothetical protein